MQTLYHTYRLPQMSAHSCPVIWLAVTEFKVANEASEENLSHPAYCQHKQLWAKLTDILSRMWKGHAGQSLQLCRKTSVTCSQLWINTRKKTTHQQSLGTMFEFSTPQKTCVKTHISYLTYHKKLQRVLPLCVGGLPSWQDNKLHCR